MSESITLSFPGEPEIYVSSILHIDGEDLSNEYASQASVYGWIATMVADAELGYNKLKHEREIQYAEAYDAIRYDYENRGEKFTEAKLNASVALDELYIKAKKWEREAEHKYKTYKLILDAMKMRADMLISLGAHLRAEQYMTGMKINQSNVKLERAARKATR